MLGAGAAGFTRACPDDDRASPMIAGLPLVLFVSPSLTSGFLSTPPRGGAVAFGSRFPPSGPAEDLHLQSNHPWHTMRKARSVDRASSRTCSCLAQLTPLDTCCPRKGFTLAPKKLATAIEAALEEWLTGAGASG
jgi:hypothetical protein